MRSLHEKIDRAFPKSSFSRGVALLSGGTVLAQGIILLASPVLTRLYTPEQFGLWAVFGSIIAILVVTVGLRYELAIPLPADDRDAAQLVLFGLTVVLVVCLTISAGLLLLGDGPAQWMNAEGLQHYLWLVPPTLVAVGAYQVLNYWTTRNKRFSLLSLARVLQAGGQAFTQVLAGLVGAGASGLIGGYALSRLIGLAWLLRGSKLPERRPDVRRWRELAADYRKFPAYTLWASLTNVIGVSLPPVLIAKYFGLGPAGLFALTTRVLSVPSTLVAQAVGQVFYPTAAERRDMASRSALVEKVASVLLVISLPVFAFVGMHGPTLFTSVFGPEWTRAGLFARYLAPWFVLSFISSPISTYALISEKQREALLITVYETGLRLGAIWLGGRFGSEDLAVGLYAGAGVVISIVYISWVLSLAGSSVFAWLGHQGPFIAGCGTVIVVLMVLRSALAGIAEVWLIALSAVCFFSLAAWGWSRLGLAPDMRVGSERS